MSLVNIEDDVLHGMLMERLIFWDPSDEKWELFDRMYRNLLKVGRFDYAQDFNVKYIVDNDYVNNCRVVRKGGNICEKTYRDIKKAVKKAKSAFPIDMGEFEVCAEYNGVFLVSC